MVEIVPNENQLNLGVKISFFSVFLNKVKRKLREFSYSAAIIFLKNWLFWFNSGAIVLTGYVLFLYSNTFPVGKGILLESGYFSKIPELIPASLVKFHYLPNLFYTMLLVHLLVFLIASRFVRIGKSGIVIYVLGIELAVIITFSKLLLSPLFLLGW